MKNILYSILASLIVLTSCSDASPIIPEVNNGKYTVRFAVKNNNTFELTRATTALSDKIKYLEYWVLDESTAEKTEVAHKVVTTASEIDAPILLELPKGKYALVLYATTNVSTQSSPGRYSATSNKLDFLYVSAPNFDTDAFSKTLLFEVDGTSIVQDIALQRMVARIELAIEDLNDLPAEVQSITPFLCGQTTEDNWRVMTEPQRAFIYPNTNGIGVNWLSDITIPKTIQRSEFASITKDNPIVFYTIPTSPSVNIHDNMYGDTLPTEFYIEGSKSNKFSNAAPLQAPHLMGNVAFFRKIKFQFKWEANKIYRYVGKIGPITGNVEIGFNEEWNESTTTID